MTNARHPLTVGLQSTWTSVDGGCSIVDALADTVVVATTDLCGPALSYKTFGRNGGMVIHINDDFGEDSDAAPDTEALKILFNAVNFGGM